MPWIWAWVVAALVSHLLFCTHATRTSSPTLPRWGWGGLGGPLILPVAFGRDGASSLEPTPPGSALLCCQDGAVHHLLELGFVQRSIKGFH